MPLRRLVSPSVFHTMLCLNKGHFPHVSESIDVVELQVNKAVYTAAPVAGGWAGAVMSWAGAVTSWAGAIKAIRILKVKA